MTTDSLTTDPLTIAVDLAAPDRYGRARNAEEVISRLPGTTPTQRRAILRAWRVVIDRDGLGDGYEYESFKVQISFNLDSDRKPDVFIFSAVRLATPGTWGHMRPTYRLLTVGARGAYRCLNAARFTKDAEGKVDRVPAANVKGERALRCSTL